MHGQHKAKPLAIRRSSFENNKTIANIASDESLNTQKQTSVVAVVCEGVGEAHREGEREIEVEGKRERERERETERETERQREPRGTSKSIENLARIYRFENELKVNRKSTGNQIAEEN